MKRNSLSSRKMKEFNANLKLGGIEMKKKSRSSRKMKEFNVYFRANFTLVELLITIAIIAILASMLLPALNKVRDKAKTISCTNSQKQLMTATLMYTQDNDGYFPAASYMWYVQLNSTYLPFKLTAENTMIDPSGILRCPADTHPGQVEPSGMAKTLLTSFALNYSAICLNANSIWKISRCKHTSRFMIYADGGRHEYDINQDTNPLLNYYVRTTTMGVSRRHAGGSNVSFADGSVRKLAKETIDNCNINKEILKDWGWK